ncbi:MAG: DUF4263 domain-containing protein [Fibrobacter sp.]|nr:DUF4263 domain-containing protein [Fibrobacter sp.]
MSIEVKKQDDKIVLKYFPERGEGTFFITENFEKKGRHSLKGVFVFEQRDVLEFDDLIYVFCLGKLNNDGYFDIESRILRLNHNLRIHKDVVINAKTFFETCRNRHFSVFSELDKIIKRDMIIGGDKESAIPVNVFYEIINCTPSDYEIDKYIDARFSSILSTVFDDGIDDFLGKFEAYKQKKLDRLKKQLKRKESNFGGEELKEYEIIKYKGIKDKIEQWLNDSAENHSEAEWQHLLKDVIPLLFPKYIAVFEEAPIDDPYKKTVRGSETRRELDYLLVDADGNCDIAEIKAPFDHCILATTLYRNNYVPLRELSGAIMQVEKYIFYMNKKGLDAERKLETKYRDELPKNFNIRITNPKGLVILGRSNTFDEKQKRDFEIIKRKYQHIMDILSYDDLLNRLDNIISMLEFKGK